MTGCGGGGVASYEASGAWSVRARVAWTVHHVQNHTLGLNHSPAARQAAAVLGEPSSLRPHCNTVLQYP